MEASLLAALHASPSDALAYHALADWLEEHGEAARSELLRLDLRLRELPAEAPERPALEERLQALLAEGVRPCVPTLTNSAGMVLVLVPPGRFRMGAPDDEPDRMSNEGPMCQVTITRPFYLGAFLVTQEEYARVMKGRQPSRFRPRGRNRAHLKEGQATERFPVDDISWDMAVEFCTTLSALAEEQEAGRVYRLPTEAEWEYACRAGTSTPFAFGRQATSREANFDGNYPYCVKRKTKYRRCPTEVGSFPPNAWGLHDMHGNLWEWCHDWYRDELSRRPLVNPTGPRLAPSGGGPHSDDPGRVQRGGSWFNSGLACRSARRRGIHAEDQDDQFGFRVAMTVKGRGRGTPKS